jgi:transposase
VRTLLRDPPKAPFRENHPGDGQRNRFVEEAAWEYGLDLLFLPPYSPNLNLIERLWKLVKKRCLTNCYYEDFAAFTAAIDRCLDSLDSTLRDEALSLLTLNFQFFPERQTSCATV